MAKNTEYEFEETMVTLTDEDGIDKDFYVDEIYEVDGQLYAALIPGFVENITEYYVFRIKDLGNDDFELEDINELPIAFNIAWYEQKAVIVLLSLLYLGVKNIHLGPTLPAFLSPNVAKVLVENFGIGGITNVEDDLKMFMEE